MKRELWADYVKVVAIFLMQMCHFHLASIDATIFIYMFHMPVFFFVSGYFDKGKSISKDIILKNVRTLIVPYVFFSLLSIPFFLSVVVRHPELYGYNPIYQQILKMIIGIAIMDDTIKPFAFLPCPELWFLVALFWVRISFSLLFLSVRKQGWVIFLFVIFMFSIGLIYRPPYFSWDSACFAFPFYIVGYITKRNELLKYFANRLVCVLSVFWGIIYLVFIGMQNGYVHIDKVIPGESYLMFYINGTIGSVVLVLLCRFYKGNSKNIFSRIGQSTITILGTHMSLLYVFIICIGYEMNPIPFGLCLTMCIISTISGTLLHHIILKRIPFVLGR